MLPLMSGLILCNHLKIPTHIHHFFNMMFNHDESQVDYLGYKELFIMNDGQTHANTNKRKQILPHYHDCEQCF